MSTATLPAGFESLAPFVDYWAQATTEARLRARCEARMEDIQAFYDAMLPLAAPAIDRLDRAQQLEPSGELPSDLATLAQLVLSLAQAAVAVEMHGQPRSPGTPWPHSVRVPGGAGPFA